MTLASAAMLIGLAAVASPTVVVGPNMMAVRVVQVGAPATVRVIQHSAELLATCPSSLLTCH